MTPIKTMLTLAVIFCCLSFTNTSYKISVNKKNISWTYEGKFYDPGISGYLYVWCWTDDPSTVAYGTYSLAVNPHYTATGSYNVSAQYVTSFTMSNGSGGTVAGTPYTGYISY